MMSAKKKMKVTIPKTAAIVLIIGLLALLSGMIVPNIYILTFSALAIWVVSVIYSAQNIRNRFSLLSYNIGFFLFILGGHSIELFSNHNTDYLKESRVIVSLEAINHVGICMVICMLFVNFTYMLLSSMKANTEVIYDLSKCLHPNKTLRSLLVFLIIIGYVCKLLIAIEYFIVVKNTSFREQATTASSLPSYVSTLESLYFVSLFAFWGTIPSKRSTVISFLTLAIPEVFLLLGGERGEPISIVMVIIFYIMFRNRIGNYDFTLKKRTIVIILIASPLIIYALQILSYSRNHLVNNQAFFESIREFFTKQGGSVRIVSNSYVMHDKIEEAGGHTFVLGEIRSYLKNNIFARMITGRRITARTVEDAFTGDNFLRTYGYLYAPVTYKAGVGGGSTYIAEVYHDGGYLFLTLFNVIIAIILSKLDLIKIGSIVNFVINMSVFTFIARLPREQALQWLTGTFAIPNLLFYLFIYVLYIKPSQNDIKESTN